MMKVPFITLILSLLISSVPVFGAALAVPSLPDDPNITKGQLPDGISYYIVSNSTEKGLAEFTLVRKGWDARSCTELLDSLPRFGGRAPADFLAGNGIAYGKEGFVRGRDNDVSLRFRNVRVPSGESVTDSLLLIIFDMIDAGGPSSGDAIIISGDVNASAMISKLKNISLMIPRRTYLPSPSHTSQWEPRDSALCSVVADSSAAVPTLTVSYASPRVADEYIGTSLPAVSERLGENFWAVLKMKLEKKFASESIPVGDLRYNYVKSTTQRGDEVFSVELTTPPDRIADAAEAVGEVLAAMDASGTPVNEYVDARSIANSVRYKNLRRTTVRNSDYVDRCIYSFLYGSSLVSDAGKEQFFTRGVMGDAADCKLFNNFTAALLDSAANLSLVCRADSEYITADSLLASFRQGWRNVASGAEEVFPSAVNWSDTLSFPVPEERCKVSKTRIVAGTEFWTFANGMTVAYKRMSTDGLFYYSMILRGGYAAMKDMKDGEGAFLSDMFGLYDVCGIDGRAFRHMLLSAGISMRTDVTLSHIDISGSLPSKQFPLLMKSLLALSGGLSVDEEVSRRYMTEERLRLAERQDNMFLLDSLLFRGDRYSDCKSASNLNDDLPLRAEAFFRTQFAKADDGVLVIIGDKPSYVVKKQLQSYMGGFSTVKKRVIKPVVNVQPVTGSYTYFAEGQSPKLEMLMTAPLQMTPGNYMSFQAAVLAVQDALTEALNGTGMYAQVRTSFPVYPSERVFLHVTVAPADLAGLPAGTEVASPVRVLAIVRSALKDLAQGGVPDAELSLHKTMIKNRWDGLQNNPNYWLSVISGRFAGGKDLKDGYADWISSVSADSVKDVLAKLYEGARIEYVTK